MCEIRSTNRSVDTVPKADAADVERALAGAVEGARIMRAMPGYERYHILNKASRLMKERQADLARTLTLEEGKPIARIDGRSRAGRGDD